MSSKKIFLEKVHIKNFLSLHDVVLSLKRLTVLVGSNASGKSNTLNSLRLLNRMMLAENLPPSSYVHESLWAGGADSFSIKLYAQINQVPVIYRLEIGGDSETLIRAEELSVGDVEVIAVKDGHGEVRDEEGANNVTPYNPSVPKLALTSAGDYGGKPLTSALNEFIRNWEFYDFQPKKMREGRELFEIVRTISGLSISVQKTLDDDGSTLNAVLADWSENHQTLFESVSNGLEASTNLRIEKHGEGDDVEFYLQEGYDTPIQLKKASDGTLRLVAYYILLNQPKLPSLIAIEEPERNLHPAALSDIASVLEQLAERTQVIITTHSSQLLDALNPKNLPGTLGVLLLRNLPGQGTEIINLEDVQKDYIALHGWIEDFGIGSAIFESELLQELVES